MLKSSSGETSQADCWIVCWRCSHRRQCEEMVSVVQFRQDWCAWRGTK